MAFSLEVRSLQSHNAELEEMVKYQEGMIVELRQTVSACGLENNSLRSMFDILADCTAHSRIGSSSSSSSLLSYSFIKYRVSTTPRNLREYNWSFWKFLCKMSKIDHIGFQS